MHEASANRNGSMNRDADRWFRCQTPIPSPISRMYCVPFAGGGPSAFRNWQPHFPDTEIWTVHLPGRESRMTEPPYSNMNALMKILTPLITEHAKVPFSLFGHSMGAMIAFELARNLEAEGRVQPACLFVSGYGAPSNRPASTNSHRLPDAEFAERIRSFEGTPEEVFAHPELLDIFLPILRADITLLETYTCDPNAQVHCPIVALGANADKEVEPAAIAAWRAHTRGAFDMLEFDGGHFYWQSDPEPLLNALNSALQLHTNSDPR